MAAPGQGPHPFRPMLGCREWLGPPECPLVGGATRVLSIPLGFILLPQWELEASEGWLGPSFSSSPADPAASTDTLLTGIDWLGLSGVATQREGSACSRGCGLGGRGPVLSSRHSVQFFQSLFLNKYSQRPESREIILVLGYQNFQGREVTETPKNPGLNPPAVVDRQSLPRVSSGVKPQGLLGVVFSISCL